MVHLTNIRLFTNQELHLQEIHFLTFDLELGMKLHETLPNTLYLMWHVHLQSLKLLRPTVKEEMHLQRRTYYLAFDLGFNVTQNAIDTLYIVLPMYLHNL